MTAGVANRSRWRWTVAVAGLVWAALLACGCATQSQGQRGLPTVSMRIGSRTFELEIARTQDQLETGLMNRDAMPADHGMIFVFDSDQLLHFWMKDTRFPLDVVFVNSGGEVVSVRQMAAYDTKTDTTSEGLAEYAIELNLGAAAAAGVLPGDHLDIPAAARAAPTTQSAR
jgi:uncharacterized membrane protein (UPF0127 family)